MQFVVALKITHAWISMNGGVKTEFLRLQSLNVNHMFSFISWFVDMHSVLSVNNLLGQPLSINKLAELVSKIAKISKNCSREK